MRKAKRIEKIPLYLFAEIDKKKAEAQARGVNIIDLSIGDPDQPTPHHILEKFHEAVNNPQTHNYPPYEGISEFRKAVAHWYKKRFNVDLDPEKEVLSLIGSKEGIAHIFLALIDPGDYALIPDPAYPVYKIWTHLAGGKPYLLPLKRKNNFLPDLTKIRPTVLPKAKLLFINYPNNPTAAVTDRNFYEEVVALAKEHNFLICSDLAYSEVSFDGYKPMSILEIPGAKEVAIEFHSLSKTYNMTGWRIGMAVGNEEAMAALSVIKTNADSGVFKAIQYAAVEALTGPQDSVEKMKTLYARRRDILIDGLNSLGWKLEKTKATFYVWVPVPRGYTAEKFAAELLEKTGVLVVPGSGYGQYGEGYVRFSITIAEERIAEAVERMRKHGIKFS